jgi:hypothetical protein
MEVILVVIMVVVITMVLFFVCQAVRGNQPLH